MASTAPLTTAAMEHGGARDVCDTSADCDSSAEGIPYRLEQVMISFTFILASVFLELDFISFQCLQSALKESPPDPSYFASLCNWFGTLQGWLWLQGFILLAHWLHSVGATNCSLLGCYLKMLASLFFCLQPMTGVAGTRSGAGLWWSNLVGIICFHTGNMVSVLDFRMNTPPGASRSKGWLFHGNLPITGMWIYLMATWCLLGSNFLSCEWSGNKSWMDADSLTVQLLMYIGGGLLFLGSCVYAIWCNASHVWT